MTATAAAMMRTLALTSLLTLAAGAGSYVHAQPVPTQEDGLTIGIFLPNAGFSSNAARSAWADRIAAAIQSKLQTTSVRGRAFAKRSDVSAFLAAGKIDLLIADGLFLLDAGGKMLAHGVDGEGRTGPPLALYAAAGTGSVRDLKGKTVAVAGSSARDTAFFVNVVLQGEIAPARFFGATRTTKDAASALGAVKAGAALGAFAVDDHPASEGLARLASGGAMPMALLATGVGSGKNVSDEAAAAALAAVQSGAGRGGGIAAWRAGGGGVLKIASAARRAPIVTSARVVLAPRTRTGVGLPRIKLRSRGALPPPAVDRITLAPTLPPEDDKL